MTITPADALDLRIAQGPPQQDLGGQIAKLPDSYWAGLDEAYKRRNQNAFQGGIPTTNGQPDGPPDFAAMLRTIGQVGGTGPALESAKAVQQLEIMRGLQGMSGQVFGSEPGTVQPSVPQPAPMQQPSSARIPGGDNGRTVMGALGDLFPEDVKLRTAQAVARSVKVNDVNAPLSPEQFQLAQENAQRAAAVRRPAPQPPVMTETPGVAQPAPPESPGTAGIENDPTLGGLVPPGRTPQEHLRLLGKAAALANSTNIRDAGKPYIDAADAIQRRLQPTDKYKDFLAGKKPGETYQQWLDRDEANKQSLTVLKNSIIPRIEKSQEAANGARDDLNAIGRAREEINADKGIFSGKFAEQKLQLQKLGTLFGMDDREVANTEAFKAAVGSRVMGLVKGLGSGTSISNSDRVFAEKMSGGQIELNETSLRRIFDIGEKAAKLRMKQHDVLVDRAVAANPALKQFEKVYRVDQVEAPKAAPAEGAKQAPDGNWYLPDPKRPGKYLMVK